MWMHEYVDVDAEIGYYKSQVKTSSFNYPRGDIAFSDINFLLLTFHIQSCFILSP